MPNGHQPWRTLPDRRKPAPLSGTTIPREIPARRFAAPQRGRFVFVPWVCCAHPRLLLFGLYAQGGQRAARSAARRAGGYLPGVSPPDRPPNDPCTPAGVPEPFVARRFSGTPSGVHFIRRDPGVLPPANFRAALRAGEFDAVFRVAGSSA